MSLISRFVRPRNQYIPTDNVEETIAKICQTNDVSGTFLDSKQKFTILNECFKTFSHSVPSSCLSEIKTIGEYIQI